MFEPSYVDERYDHGGKQYVDVYVMCRKDGSIVPVSFISDNRECPVDRVLERRPAASLKAGGTGIRYTVRIMGRETYLWLEGDRWFMETEEA